jgi:poly(beta-D-mannuronate) lyase
MDSLLGYGDVKGKEKRYARFSLCASTVATLMVMVSMLAGMGSAQAVQAQESLKSVFDVAKARSVWASSLKTDTAEFTCAEPPKPVVQFEAESRYCDGDKTRSTVCPDKEKKYLDASKDIDAFNKGVIDMANRYVQAKKPRPEVAQCVLSHLDNWATAGAWAPDEAQKGMTGEYKRGISLAAMASALLMVQDEPSLSKDALERVHAWMQKIGYKLHDYSQIAVAKGSNTGLGNHRYWEGLGEVQAAIATQDHALYRLGMTALDVGVHQVEEGGVLPIEMKRAKKAFDYHLFAITPLVMLAEISRVNDEPLSAEDDAKLQSVVQLVTNEMLDKADSSAKFMKKSYYKDLKSNQLTFLEIYLKNHGNPTTNSLAFDQARIVKEKRKEDEGMLHSTMLGGDVTFFFGTPNVVNANQ